MCTRSSHVCSLLAVCLALFLAFAGSASGQEAPASYCMRTAGCGHNKKEEEFRALLRKFGLDDEDIRQKMGESNFDSIYALSQCAPSRVPSAGVPAEHIPDFERLLRHIGARGHEPAKWRPGERNPKVCEHCGERESNHHFREKFCSEIGADNAIIFQHLKALKRERNETFLEVVQAGNVRHTKLMLEAGVFVNCIDSADRKETALFHAIRRKHVAIVDLLISNGADVNVRNEDGHMPLHKALMDASGDKRITHMLLSADAKVDEPGGTENYYPLHYAVEHQNLEILKSLLEEPYEAIVDVKCRAGNTPLNLAVQKKLLYFAEELLKAGADVSIENQEKQTPLSCALKDGDPFMLDLLKRYSKATYDGIDEDTRLKIDL